MTDKPNGNIVELGSAPAAAPLQELPPEATAQWLEETVAKVVPMLQELVPNQMGHVDRVLERETRKLDPAGLLQPVVTWNMKLHLTELGESLKAKGVPDAEPAAEPIDLIEETP